MVKGARYDEPSLELLVALGRLPERTREVVIERFFRGLTLQSVADMIGVTKERVRQIEQSGLRLLAVELRRLGYEL